MIADYLTHAELQHIEHSNKVLREHLELVTKVTNETEALLNNYVPILKGYVSAIADIHAELVHTVSEVVKSTRDLKVITSNNQQIQDYVAAVNKLKQALDDKLTEKIITLVVGEQK